MSALKPGPRFRAKVYAYHHGKWRWGYDVLDMRPLDRRYRPGRVVAGRAQFASQPEALAAACATLRNLGTGRQWPP